MIQLKNLRDELTGLVEGRCGSLQDQIDNLPDSSGNLPPTRNFVTLDGNDEIYGNKTFHNTCAFLDALTVRSYSDAGGGQLRLMYPFVNDPSAPFPSGQVLCVTFTRGQQGFVPGNVWDVGTDNQSRNFFIRTGSLNNCCVINTTGIMSAVYGLQTPSISLNGADLRTTLDGKQASLTADATGTKILNQTTIRSLTAERNVTHEVVGDAIKIRGPDLSGYPLNDRLRHRPQIAHAVVDHRH